MESTNWAPEHSDALRELSCRGMSYSEIAQGDQREIQHGLFPQRRDRPRQADGACGRSLDAAEAAARCRRPRPQTDLQKFARAQNRAPEFRWPQPVFEAVKPVKLRCVEIEPRHLSLIELEHGDCRYPYGGDEEGEAITFCGHPKRPGSSYCTPHFHLTRNPDACRPNVRRAPSRFGRRGGMKPP